MAHLTKPCSSLQLHLVTQHARPHPHRAPPLGPVTPHAPLQVPLTEAEKAERAAAAASKPNKLALGTEGGFALEAQKDYTLDKSATLVVLQGLDQPRLQVPLPCPDLPELVLNVITAIQVGA